MFPIDPLSRIVEGAIIRYFFDKPSRSEVQSKLFNQLEGNSYAFEVPDRRNWSGLGDEIDVFEEVQYSVTNVKVDSKDGLYSYLFDDWQVGVVLEFETDSLLKYDAMDEEQLMEKWLRRLLSLDNVETADILLFERIHRKPKLVLIFDTHEIFDIKNGLDKFSYLIGEYFSIEWQAWKHSVEEHDEPLPLTWGLQRTALGLLSDSDNTTLKEDIEEGFLERSEQLFRAYSEVDDMPEKQ